MPVTANAYKLHSSVAAWWLVWAVVHTYLVVGYGVSIRFALLDATTSCVLLAAAGWVINFNLKFYLPRREKYWYIIIVSFVLAGAVFDATKSIALLVKDEAYSHLFSEAQSVRFAFYFLMTCCMAILSLLWQTQKEQAAVDSRKAEADALTRDAELFKLRQQLQPHFLFNSLNSISALAGLQPEKARHMIQQLSDFLRGTLRKADDQWTSLEEELTHLQLYLEIEKVRFGHRLQTKINCTETACAMRLPALLLQPLVENAIKFGLYGVTGEVQISIEALHDADLLKIVITNPYDAETGEAGRGTGFGLASVQRRLFLLFARKDLLQTDASGQVFTTTLIIPQQQIVETS